MNIGFMYLFELVFSEYMPIGEDDGTLLQYSCLENPRDRGAWWAAIYGVAQSRTRLKRLSSSSSYSLNSFYSLLPYCVEKSVLYVCVYTVALKIHSL